MHTQAFSIAAPLRHKTCIEKLLQQHMALPDGKVRLGMMLLTRQQKLICVIPIAAGFAIEAALEGRRLGHFGICWGPGNFHIDPTYHDVTCSIEQFYPAEVQHACPCSTHALGQGKMFARYGGHSPDI